MKSNELFEQIHSGQIKDNTKISVINELTGNCITEIEYKNQRLNWISGEFDTSFLCNIDIDFEIIEENKEIEELPHETYLELKKGYYNIENILNGIRIDLKRHQDKINKLVRAVNKLNKEREDK